jgi:MSHA biogenesis protein MshN
MVLARLQLESGDPALDTLLKTLPYAGAIPTITPSWRACCSANSATPKRRNITAMRCNCRRKMQWWMGLGISLQADQHLPEAREAYNRARSTGGLTPELRSFVDRKIEQLAR